MVMMMIRKTTMMIKLVMTKIAKSYGLHHLNMSFRCYS